MRGRTAAIAAAGAVAGPTALYRRVLRRPVLTWGATPEEAAGRLPGDELLVMEPGSLVMERQMLVGIRTRTEQLAAY